MNYYIAIDREGNFDLCHYGIKGQKWGIRRYQNPDGSLTSEGKQRMKAEYKADNKKAFELGKKATITGRALEKSAKRLNKYPNDELEKTVNKRLKQEHSKNVAEMKKHYNELVKKYGKEAIRDIAYDRKGRLNERVVTGKEFAVATLISLSTLPLAALGSPVGVIAFPKNANDRGRDYYVNTLVDERKKRNGG